MAKQPSEETPHTTVTCYTCHERMHVPVRKVSRKIACTDCGRPVHVPGLDELATHRTPEVKEMVRDVGEYELAASAPTDVTTLATTPYLDAQARHFREPEPPRPKSTFFSGVFLFPFSEGVLSRWISLSILLFMALAVAGVALAVGGNLGQVQAAPQGAVLAFFILPEIWLGLWSVSYGTACSLAIIEGTASGLAKVEHWPEPNWREWMAEFFFALWLAAVTATIAWTITLPLRWLRPEEPRSLWILLMTLWLFPFVILSALESHVAWIPWSPRTFQTLIKHPWYWLLYLILESAVAAVALGIAWLVGTKIGVIAIALFAPVLAAAWFIEARLLGRLAYRISREA